MEHIEVNGILKAPNRYDGPIYIDTMGFEVYDVYDGRKSWILVISSEGETKRAAIDLDSKFEKMLFTRYEKIP